MNDIFVPQDRTELSVWLKARTQPITLHGSLPREGQDQLVLSRLNRLVLYEPGEMIVQVEAGMTLHELQRLLREQNQWIPTLEPEEDECTTVGGALSLDRYHPRTKRHSALRTAVLGGTFCTSSGELFRSGSRVVKSVAGYDTHRAFVGAMGRLGVIVEVTLRVLPRPERFARFTIATDAYSSVLREEPSVLEHAAGALIVELSGYAEDVEESIGRLSEYTLELLGDDAWASRICELRTQHFRPEAARAAIELLEHLQTALDPKGVLRAGR